MAQQSRKSRERLSLSVSTAQRPEFKQPLEAFLFDPNGNLIERSKISNGKLELTIMADVGKPPRLLVAPVVKDAPEDWQPSLDRLMRLGAYEPSLRRKGRLIDQILIPGTIIDLWPFCFCWVRGRVVRASDNRVVCNARVNICEVDRLPLWIQRLPDSDIFRLRNDLFKIFDDPPIPWPWPPRPQPYPPPINFFRLDSPGSNIAFNPQAGQLKVALRFNDRASAVALNPQPVPPKTGINLPLELRTNLLSQSSTNLRRTLAEHWKILIPLFCYWQHWWWRFRCDHLSTVETDEYGNFETLVIYPCYGDHPDLYFWVEYDFGSGWETVYRPAIACHTYWNYACGTEVTVRVTDPRVPACDSLADLDNKEVRVLSIGNDVSIIEVGTDGLTNLGEPFGSTLEVRVDFGRTKLISAGISCYRWSYRRLSDPVGNDLAMAGPWTPFSREVLRHYKTASSAIGVDVMGPTPSPVDGLPLYLITPIHPSLGSTATWSHENDHIDGASGYFETAKLPGSPLEAIDGLWPDDMAAGRYELKLELFEADGTLVTDWVGKGIRLSINNANAPFVGAYDIIDAPMQNRLMNGASLDGFRMVVRVDNNRCFAEIYPVGGDVSPDPDCGHHEYDTGDDAGLSFTARHPNNFATYSFKTGRGAGSALPVATTSGITGKADANGFGAGGGFLYAKDVPVASLLGACPNAALWERLDVNARATNGYTRLGGYDADDNAAFALAQPCPGNSGGASGGG